MARDDHGKSQAKAQYDSIRRMVKTLQEHDADKDGYAAYDAAREAILEDALEVCVRTSFVAPWGPGDAPKPEEYMILLCTGGPAVRIIGKLNRYAEPETAALEYQDWGTPWTRWLDTAVIEETLLTYARCHYFGE